MSVSHARLDPAALRHNIQRVRQLVGPDKKILAMVKANAYGHRFPLLQAAFADADALGVAIVDEALVLRQLGVTQPIYVMSGFRDHNELQAFSANDFTAIIHTKEQLQLLNEVKLPQPLNVWLKLDTGMHRLGFLPEHFAAAYQTLMSNDAIKKPFGIMTHLADADNRNTHFTTMQHQVFLEHTQHLDEIKSVVNSAGILAHPSMHYHLVRPGIMLYGVSPFADKMAADLSLKPVLTLYSAITAIKDVKAGESIGYGCRWRCPKDMRIAVVGIGYGDGYPRSAEDGTPVLVNGIECPLVGRVSMDQITVDISHVSDASVGDQVVLWGAGLPIERVAAMADTIPYVLLSQLTPRVCFNSHV